MNDTESLQDLAGRLKTQLSLDIANIQSAVIPIQDRADRIILALPIELYRKRKEQLIDRINKAARFHGYTTNGYFTDNFDTEYSFRQFFLKEKEIVFTKVTFFVLLVY